MTHGYGESSQGWQRQREGLGDALDIVTWDLPGHGMQPMPDGLAVDMDTLTAGLHEIACTAPSPPLLIGHSVGGYLSLRYALTSPVPLLGLILISTGPGFRSPSRMEEWNRRIDYVTRRLQMPVRAGQSIYMKDSVVIDRLDSLLVPTLVIMGARDRDFYRAGSRYVAEHAPRATLLEVADAHHNPHQTHPAEVNRAISAFASQLLAGHESLGM